MTATQHPALLQAQLESMRSLLTDCHDYLKPVHEQFMRAEKHEEASHQIGNDLYARIGCMLSQAPEPISAPTLQAAADLASNRFEAPVVGWTAPAQDELMVYRAVNRFGSACHFGVESLPRVWAGANGSVERLALKPVPELSVVAMSPAQTEQQPKYGTYTTNPGESLMGIANRDLRSSDRWTEIRDLNAQAFPDMGPHDYYPVGTVLRMPAAPIAQTVLANQVSGGARNLRYEGLFEGETEQQRTERLASSQAAPQPEQRGLVEMIDAAMIEMRDIAPPLCRSECERLIRAAMAAKEA